MCCVANENDSGSTNKDEEEERSFVQLYARLSQEDKAVMLKLLERAKEESKARQMLEDILSIKMQYFDKLTKEHEELKCLKGKCVFGPFLSILVIECKHKCSNVKICPWMNKVQITS